MCSVVWVCACEGVCGLGVCVCVCGGGLGVCVRVSMHMCDVG